MINLKNLMDKKEAREGVSFLYTFYSILFYHLGKKVSGNGRII